MALNAIQVAAGQALLKQGVQDARRAPNATAAQLMTFAVADVNGLAAAGVLEDGAAQAEYQAYFTVIFAAPWGTAISDAYMALVDATDWEAVPVVAGV